MENQNKNTVQLNFVDAKNIAKKNDYILIFLNDGTVIRKHENFFKHVLGLEYSPVTRNVAQ